MNILNNRNKRTSIFKAVALCLIAAMSFTLVSCDDDMDIQQSYPFTVEVMPVPNKVVKGQTVEIRCELKKEGDFSGTLYTIRYFQFEGEATIPSWHLCRLIALSMSAIIIRIFSICSANILFVSIG